jgi:hypothetical protein
MGTGLCSKCKVQLVLDNSFPSVFLKQAGYCRACSKTRVGPGSCHQCKSVFDENNSNPSTLKAGRGLCRACEKLEYEAKAEQVKIRTAIWAKNNPERRKAIRMKWHRMAGFSISQEDFEAQFKIQNGRCAICSVEMTIGTPRVMIRACQDHNHATNELRGILCVSCNLLIGHCKENEKILANAILYLRKYAGGSSIQTACVDGLGINSGVS